MRYGDKHYNLIVTNMTHFHFDQCFSDIPPGNWTLYVCDGVLPNVSDTCSNPAVILTDVTITGKVHIEPSGTSTVISTSSISEVPTITGNDLHYIMYYC